MNPSQRIKSGPSRRRKIILAAILCALTGGGVVAARSMDRADPIDPSHPATAQIRGIKRSVTVTGKVQPIAGVQLSIDNSEGELKASLTACKEIVLKEHKSALTIPEPAVLDHEDRNASVWAPDIHRRDGHRGIAVKTGISAGSRMEVLSDLKPGVQVILQQTS